MSAAGDGSRMAVRVVVVAVLVAFSAHQVLVPVLAPLARELRLSEVQLGLVITTSAVMVTVASPVWGRAVERWGPRRVLATGLLVATGGLAAFAAIGSVSLSADAGAGAATYGLLLAARGGVFGVGLAAIPVAALAVVSAASDAADRTRAVAVLGAAQSSSVVLGPAAGGVLAVGGLVVPLWTAAALMAVVVVLVVVGLPRHRPPMRQDDPAAGEEAAGDGGQDRLRPWDSRVWPLLAAGFGLYLGLGVAQIVLGFLVQDRLELAPGATATTVALALVVTGCVLVAVQGVLVPRLRADPRRLLRTGTPVAAAGLLGLALAGRLSLILVVLVVLAVGLGLALPGYTSAATLLATDGEHGRVAGWVSTTNASTFVLAPTLGTALYGVSAWLPAAVGAAIAAMVWVFLLNHPDL